MNESKLEFAQIVEAFQRGSLDAAQALFDKALANSFTNGEAYAKDTVGEWNRP